jgi:hypothetical protein
MFPNLITDSSGSDLHIYRQTDPGTGYIIGHEIVGEIVQIGSAIKNFKVGDIVAAPFAPTEPRTSSQGPGAPADDAARFQRWKASLDSGTENQDTYSTLDPSVPFDRFAPDSLSWQFNPTLEMPAADREQDVMFQSMWSNDALDLATLSLYATLLGN